AQGHLEELNHRSGWNKLSRWVSGCTDWVSVRQEVKDKLPQAGRQYPIRWLRCVLWPDGEGLY
ncbi:MAG: hypothetical protein EBT08_06575, partial [Betaproteobacteria bacterium]|nr:hypothetical protein [Betaproteobacteria bacterium]